MKKKAQRSPGDQASPAQGAPSEIRRDQAGAGEPASGPRPTARGDLLDTIEHHVLPRLMIAHSGAAAEVPAGCRRQPPTQAEVGELVERSLTSDCTEALSFVEAMVRTGLSLEEVYLDLVAPAARQLGDQWLADERSFVDVTVGLATLHQVVNALRPSAPLPLLDRGTVLLTTAPREQHTLGVHLLGHLLRDAGWGTYVWPNPSESGLTDLVAKESFVMVGISVSCDDHLEPIADLVRNLRQASKNPDLAVMLGGSLDLTEAAAALNVHHASSKQEILDWLRLRRDQLES